jgi:tRNA-modifying protein YgfZ
LEEGYRLLRAGVALAPVGRDVVKVSGPDAVDYLQGQCSQDVAALATFQSADALLLQPTGRTDALVRVTRTAPDELILDSDAGFGPAVAERLERFKLRVRVEISLLGWQCLALRGPETKDLDAPGGVLVLPWQWPGISGLDLLGANPETPSGVRSCGEEAWEACRIEAGVPVMGAEIDDRTIPAEAGLVERCVSFTKGCFTGQELVARLDARGSNVARRLRGLVIPGDRRAQPLEPGTEVRAAGKPVGGVTSIAWSPGLEATVALAYVHRSVEVGQAVETGGLSAQVRELPLVS